ncbi:MAG: ATP-binding protein [Alphaproteobacteria bacterium]|nr:ATP-binding protein [Alphaproteobacteria bacterium]MCB9795349.1 ATP-binding protein [Alphaproteobacteria bacterium]
MTPWGNALDLERALAWLAACLDARLANYFGTEPRERPAPPSGGEGAWTELVLEHALSPDAQLVLLLALAPHLRPQLLDVLLVQNPELKRGFTEFGGLDGARHGGFLPTGETAAFLLAGTDLAARFRLLALLDPEALLRAEGLLQLGEVPPGEPALSAALRAPDELLHRLTTGREPAPRFSASFPARRVETALTWDDLVLPSDVLDQLAEIGDWIRHRQELLDGWGMRSRLSPGFTALFHGRPGTGKTLSAALVAAHCGRELYRIDLSTVVSKYIGETEKNLARIFDRAERRPWILFFDEADALFGRRTQVDDARDRYANQEVSFLLQRIEDFDGVVILASNLKTNIDEAFQRRFASVIHFPVPRAPERERLWRAAFSERATLEERVRLPRLASSYDLTGGTIMNVVRHASLKALARGEGLIRLRDVEEGIRRELRKEGRSM